MSQMKNYTYNYNGVSMTEIGLINQLITDLNTINVSGYSNISKVNNMFTALVLLKKGAEQREKDSEELVTFPPPEQVVEEVKDDG